MEGFIRLNIKRAELYEKVKNRNNFPKPKSETKEDRRKSKKFCNFHQDYDHLTEYSRKLFTYYNRLAK